MKGFPQKVSGPKGSWYKKINKVVSEAMLSDDPQFVKDILGEPDSVEKVAVEDRIPVGRNDIDHRYPEFYWIYYDPYRPKKMYRFGISNEKIVERSHHTKV